MLTPAQQEKYSRQIRLHQIGEAGQQRLLESSALIVGMGGLGSPAAMYLAASGLGALTVCDFDRVEPSNLQRQIIHHAQDLGELKAMSAKRTLAEINPECDVTALDWQLDEKELLAEVDRADIVLDCSDNFETRFALNAACMGSGTPLVSGAAIRMEGQIAAFLPPGRPCYRCLYGEDAGYEETCSLEGVLAPVVGVIGSMQALQAVLVLTGNLEDATGKLLLFDAVVMQWRSLRIPADPACPVCAGA
ncbi:MAG: HesA/MoeB/ThiF family protein [Pseudomonadota bacterium]